MTHEEAKKAILEREAINDCVDRLDAEADNALLRQQLADVSHERDLLRAASIEMLRIAGIANQGSNAYNRAIENLQKATQVNS